MNLRFAFFFACLHCRLDHIRRCIDQSRPAFYVAPRHRVAQKLYTYKFTIIFGNSECQRVIFISSYLHQKCFKIANFAMHKGISIFGAHATKRTFIALNHVPCVMVPENFHLRTSIFSATGVKVKEISMLGAKDVTRDQYT